MGPAIVLEGNLMKGKMLKLWLPTTGILVVIRRIYLYQFKCKYLKKQKLLLQIYCIFKIYIKFWTAWNKKTKKQKKKNEPQSLRSSETIDTERRGYLNE